jgi:GNAT superfamily N-acetyltransferase
MSAPDLAVKPLTAARWKDLAALFGPRGACAGCWCMWWRLGRSEWQAGKGEGNRRAFRRIVAAGRVPGLLAYAGREPVGWCAVAPREEHPRLARSRTLAPVDDRPVWSITCFFVRRDWRRRGVTRALIAAAVEHVRRRGGRLLEAYPIDPGGATADAWVYTGLASTFLGAGFREVARRSATRPIVRKAVRGR